MSEPIKPGKTADFVQTEGEAMRLGDQLIRTPRGTVKVTDAPGYLTFPVEHPDPEWRRIGLLLYVPGGDYAGSGTFALGVGSGMAAQMTPDQARLVATSLNRMADQLDQGSAT